MKKNDLKKQQTEIEIGEFGSIYRQFERKSKKAIRFLCKNKAGDYIRALYREDIGFILFLKGIISKLFQKRLFNMSFYLSNYLFLNTF